MLHSNPPQNHEKILRVSDSFRQYRNVTLEKNDYVWPKKIDTKLGQKQIFVIS